MKKEFGMKLRLKSSLKTGNVFQRNSFIAFKQKLGEEVVLIGWEDDGGGYCVARHEGDYDIQFIGGSPDDLFEPPFAHQGAGPMSYDLKD